MKKMQKIMLKICIFFMALQIALPAFAQDSLFALPISQDNGKKVSATTEIVTTIPAKTQDSQQNSSILQTDANPYAVRTPWWIWLCIFLIILIVSSIVYYYKYSLFLPHQLWLLAQDKIKNKSVHTELSIKKRTVNINQPSSLSAQKNQEQNSNTEAESSLEQTIAIEGLNTETTALSQAQTNLETAKQETIVPTLEVELVSQSQANDRMTTKPEVPVTGIVLIKTEPEDLENEASIQQSEQTESSAEPNILQQNPNLEILPASLLINPSLPVIRKQYPAKKHASKKKKASKK